MDSHQPAPVLGLGRFRDVEPISEDRTEQAVAERFVQSWFDVLRHPVRAIVGRTKARPRKERRVALEPEWDRPLPKCPTCGRTQSTKPTKVRLSFLPPGQTWQRGDVRPGECYEDAAREAVAWIVRGERIAAALEKREEK